MEVFHALNALLKKATWTNLGIPFMHLTKNSHNLANSDSERVKLKDDDKRSDKVNGDEGMLGHSFSLGVSAGF